MNKLVKKDKIALKFDTSSANIGCFIRGKSKQKAGEHDRYGSGYKNKRKSRYSRQKQLQFQDKAFLQSVVCKILNDADCEGITQLIDDMVFPRNDAGTAENIKDSHCELSEQQQMSQIFSNYHLSPQNHHSQKINIYPNPHQNYNLGQYQHQKMDNFRMGNTSEKQDCKSTFESSLMQSTLNSPRPTNSMNPQVFHTISPMLAYGYNYYPQGSYLYQRQCSQRKRRNGSGEQINEYKIIPQKIQSDGRTTLMVRHIPNKYSQEMLFEEIGRNYKLKINFLYLPIDHINSCNVGYAFVNFIHTKFISEFYKEYNGRSWDRFNSEKICELAYARIQGTTNLMDHFQNSTVTQRGRSSNKLEKVNQTPQSHGSSPMNTNILNLNKFENS